MIRGVVGLVVAAPVTMLCVTTTARAETPAQWIELGARVHGAFGSFIPVGIRIGLDALQRLHAERRGVTVMFYQGPKAPCPCSVDGIAIATQASVGQGTLRVSPDKAPDGTFAVAVIRDKATGAGLKYTVAASWMPKLDEMNKTLDPMGRYNAVMSAADLFTIEPVPPEPPAH